MTSTMINVIPINKLTLVTYKEKIEFLPKSLKSEISISMNKGIIPKCNLFNIGNPTFISDIIDNSIPIPVLKDDPIVLKGDYSEEIYFVKHGEVEIITSNEKTETVIARLSPGAYFGEVGVLLNQKRSLSVRAKTDCIVNQISKTIFLEILERYPEHEEILLNVQEIFL